MAEANNKKRYNKATAATTTSSRRQIACPLPLKISLGPSLASKGLPKPIVNITSDKMYICNCEEERREGRDEEKEQPYDRDFLCGEDRDEDGDSLINFIEARWELEQIFSSALPPVVSLPFQLETLSPCQTPMLDSSEVHSPFEFDFESLMSGDDFPRLGLSPKPPKEEEGSFAPYALLRPPRSHNPIPLNTPFLNKRDHYFAEHFSSSPFYHPDLLEEGKRSSDNAANPSKHMRKRSRSYSDSMLRKDSEDFEDFNKSMVLVS